METFETLQQGPFADIGMLGKLLQADWLRIMFLYVVLDLRYIVRNLGRLPGGQFFRIVIGLASAFATLALALR